MNISQLVTGPLSVNTWCVPLDGRRMMVVDPGGDADTIIAHIDAAKAEVAVLFLTHGHFDHLIALPALARRWPEALIAIHSGDSAWLGPGALERHHAFFTTLGAGSVVGRYREALPEGTSFPADGSDMFGWKVLHTPGHSPGSVCLYSEADAVLIAGDTLFKGGFGRTDGPGGSFEDLSASLERLLALPADTVVLPGHGGRTTIAAERSP